MKNSTSVFCGIRCSLIMWASVGPGCCQILGRSLSTSVSSPSLSWNCRKEGAMYHRSQRGGMKRDSRLPLLKDKYLRFGYLKQKIPLPRCESCRVPNIFARDACLHKVPGDWNRGQCLRYEAGFQAEEEQAEQKDIGTGTDVSAGHRHSYVISDFVLTSSPEWGCQDLKGHLIISLACTQLPSHLSFQVDQAFILTSTMMPNISYKKALWWNS